ncbi:MAG: hypothetical protein Q8O35_14050 [Humidesulfovibrio sp.]|uniref:hypothetical protein n=1 Tax=Humidesulfovibrio sp. TaxID=2910988 RepID=UPI0027350256|nr:hypothetical protein [Humidesulfovibrio sp.]MDP2849291.1 hypothetical protein [Humidesulfovibrio sp.]
MKCLIIIMVLLAPAAACANGAFDITCGNVASVTITRSANPFLLNLAPHGTVHGVLFFLKPEASEQFQQFAEASRQAQLSQDAGPHPPYALLSVTANGKPLRCDMLEIRGYGGKKIITFILEDKDAFDTARAVCPTAPVEFIIMPPMRYPEPGQ